MTNKIYIASKAEYRPAWREWRAKGLTFTSRWIDIDDKYIGRTLPPEYDFTELWTHCVEDVVNADVLVLYCASEDVLKGAILELGVALAMNKPCFVVGDRDAVLRNGSWLHHPGVWDMTDYLLEYVMGFAAGFDPKADHGKED